MNKRIIAKTNPQNKNYSITICKNLQSDIPRNVKDIGVNKALIITTPSVYQHYKNIIQKISNQFSDCFIYVIPVNEQSKNFITVNRICNLAGEHQLGRNDVFISICGGCCQDVVTTAAALYKRGIGVIRIPTTLIGVIDAGIGIKSSLNLKKQKSAIGIFHPPLKVLIDLNFIKTLPYDYISCGIAEIIKIAIVLDSTLFKLVENNCSDLLDPTFFSHSKKDSLKIIHKSIKGMISQLELNFHEDLTYERLVDFGHTFSNTLEPSSNWTIAHGYAVAIDIALSSYIAYRLNTISLSCLERILNLFLNLQIPITSEYLTLKTCKQAIEKVKLHRGGEINLVIPSKIGSGIFIKKDSPELYEIINNGLIYLKDYTENHHRCLQLSRKDKGRKMTCRT